MNLIPSLVGAIFTYFKADPRKAARIVVEAIGWLTVALEVVDAIVPQAIAILRQVLVGLGS